MVTQPPHDFANGDAPLEWFHVFRTGAYAPPILAGEPTHWAQLLTPAMVDFHNRLVARAYKRTGRTLALSIGFSAFRPRSDQRRAKRLYGRGAAAVGFSSHGLKFEGRLVGAFDYGNWAWVYADHGGKAAWYADIRAEGGTAGYFDPSVRPGTPYEPWHVIIDDPFRLGVASGSGSGSGTGTPTQPGEDDMPLNQDDKAHLDRLGAAIIQQVLDGVAGRVPAPPAVPSQTGSGGVQLFERTGSATQEWMIVDPTLPPDGIQDGYRVTTDGNLARLWGRQYAGPGTAPIHVARAQYVEHQAWARERAKLYRESQAAIVRSAL